MKRTSKIIFSVVGFLTTTILLAMVVSAAWFVSSPRSIPVITEQIQQKLNDITVEYKFEIKDTVLQWDGWRENLNLHIRGLKVTDVIGNEVLFLPDIGMDIDITRIFLGEIVLDEAKISKPIIHATLPRKKEVVFHDAEQAQESGYNYSEMSAILFGAIAKSFSIMEKMDDGLFVRNISLKDGRLLINNGLTELSWDIPESYLTIDSSKDSTAFELTTEILDELTERRSFFNIKAKDEKSSDNIEVELEVNNVSSLYIADFFPDLDWLGKIDVALTGKSHFIASTDGKIDIMDFSILSKADETLAVGVSGNFKILPDFNGVTNIPIGRINIEAKAMPVEDLGKYWPPNLGSDAREWVVANLPEGNIEEVHATITVTPEDFVAGIVDKSNVEGEMIYSGLRVNYIDGFQPITDAGGVAHFDGTSITFDVQKGSLGESSLEGIVYIYDIDKYDVMMEVDARTTGPVADVKKFLELLQSSNNSEENLIDISKIDGKADTSHFYKFILEKALTYDQVEFRAKSELQDVSLPSVASGINLTGGGFSLSVDRNKMSLDGDGYLNGALAKIKWIEDFTGKNKYSSEYYVNSYLSSVEFVKLGGPDIDGLKGNFSTAIEIKQQKSKRDIFVKADLKDSDISLDFLGWKKPIGEDASLSAQIEEGKENYVIKNLSLKAKDMEASGLGQIEKGKEIKSMFDIVELKSGKTDMHVRVVNASENEYVVTVEGKVFDAGPLLEDFSGGVEDDHAADKISIDAELLLEKMLLKNGVVINNVQGHALCQTRCKTVDIKGSLSPGQDVEIKLNPDNKDMVFSIISDNGGATLKGLDIINHVEGGHFVTSAKAPIDDPTKPFHGKLVMQDFKVQDAPVLAKLLTVASFTGIVELLQDEGISFNKMKGQYSFKDNILKLREIKATGASLAITAEGDVDLNKGELKLQGNVVPATLLNKVLENIPFFGFAITGGGEESVIATRYTITGTFANPDITVNPFSILTPGFLRNIWGDVLDDTDDSALDEGFIEDGAAPIEKH